MLFPSNIVSYGSSNKVLQSRFINRVTLVEIDRPRFFRVKASIEEFLRIFQESALCLSPLIYYS
jgi:hypothetical protein